ncbi:MAG: prepilin peptidase [Verrucomicrobiota bacterium]
MNLAVVTDLPVLVEFLSTTREGYLIASVFVVLFGGCVGSFLNVCIYRIPEEGLSIIRPRSYCPQCGKPLAIHHNIPLIGWFLLRGTCRFCKEPIAKRYPLVEWLTAFLFFGVWFKYGMTPLTPIFFLFMGGLIVGTFIDIDHLILPDRITWGGALVGIVISAFVPALHKADTLGGGLSASVIGATVGFGLLGLIMLLGELIMKKEAMGFGDVKLMAAIGAFLGWQSILFTILISSLVGSVFGISMVYIKGKDWDARIPFGPYLAAAAIIWVLGGESLWNAYLEWVTMTKVGY